MSDTILFLSHTEADGSLSKGSLEALGAAIDLAVGLGGTLTVGLFGGDTHEAANSIANCGAQRFLAVAEPEFAEPRYSTDAGAAEIICRSAVPSIVVTPATSRCARIMSGVAFRLAGRADTHVNSITVTDGRPTITRWFYRQRMVAELSRVQRPWLLVYESGCHAAYSGESGTAQVELLKLVVGDDYKRTKVSGIIAPKADAQTIRPDAELLFVAGAGWTKKQKDGHSHPEDAEKCILGFLRETKASLGSSKSLV